MNPYERKWLVFLAALAVCLILANLFLSQRDAVHLSYLAPTTQNEAANDSGRR